MTAAVVVTVLFVLLGVRRSRKVSRRRDVLERVPDVGQAGQVDDRLPLYDRDPFTGGRDRGAL